jgi:hypothetical protein
METKVRLNYVLQAREGFYPMNMVSPEDIHLSLDGMAEDVKISSWSVNKGKDGWQCNLEFRLPDPRAKRIDQMKAEAFMTIAGETEEFTFTAEQIRAMAKNDKTGIPALDDLEISVEVSGHEIAFRYASLKDIQESKMSDHEILCPIVSGEITTEDRYGISSMDGHEWDGAYTLPAIGGMEEGTKVSITVARAWENMMLPLTLESYEIP